MADAGYLGRARVGRAVLVQGWIMLSLGASTMSINILPHLGVPGPAVDVAGLSFFSLLLVSLIAAIFVHFFAWPSFLVPPELDEETGSGLQGGGDGPGARQN